MPKIYTIGHSTHPLDEFLMILNTHKITHLVDIRTIPKSRRFPWFNGDKLKVALRNAKIKYTHLEKLGGLRHAKKDSINQEWHNLSFRGFADYMQTKEFYEGLKKLNGFLKGRKKLVIMCAESLPWRCHRSLIADAEIVRGIEVYHIMSRTSLHTHSLTSFAVVDRTKRPIKIYYPKKITEGT